MRNFLTIGGSGSCKGRWAGYIRPFFRVEPKVNVGQQKFTAPIETFATYMKEIGQSRHLGSADYRPL